MPKIREWYLEKWDNRICGICNGVITTHEDVSLDHIIPVSRKGLPGLENCHIVHKECNAVKGEFTLEELSHLINSVNPDALKILWLRLKQSNLLYGRRWK